MKIFCLMLLAGALSACGKNSGALTPEQTQRLVCASVEILCETTPAAVEPKLIIKKEELCRGAQEACKAVDTGAQL